MATKKVSFNEARARETAKIEVHGSISRPRAVLCWEEMDGRFHIWLDELLAPTSVMYKNALPGAEEFRTRHLQWDTNRRRDLVKDLLAKLDPAAALQEWVKEQKAKQIAEEKAADEAARIRAIEKAGPELLLLLEETRDSVALLATGRCPADLVAERILLLQKVHAKIDELRGAPASYVLSRIGSKK